ncbi:hypothetical protein GCM10009718_27650 [Isoptericola halotolerans]
MASGCTPGVVASQVSSQDALSRRSRIHSPPSRRRSGRSTTAPDGVSSRRVTGHGLVTAHLFASFIPVPSSTRRAGSPVPRTLPQ